MSGKMTMNFIRTKDLDVTDTINCNGFIYNSSTDTTSITVVTGITSTMSTEVNFTTQTIYLTRGVIVNFSTVTSTGAILD